MKDKINSFEQLDITLRAEDVAKVLNISRAGAYQLMHAEGFPTIRIGKRLIVPRDKFLQWIEENIKR